MNVTILGAGAWGTALGLLASRNGATVTVQGHDPEHLAAMAATQRNERSLPGIALPADWQYEDSVPAAAEGADLVVVATPSHAFRGVASQLSNFEKTVVTVTKGVELQTGLTMSGVLEEVASRACAAALSGPSLALEVAKGIPTAVVAASRSKEAAQLTQQIFHQAAFRVYTSSDLIGVELGGALKNVMAIAAGVCDGLRFGDNAKAALITRGMAEMRRIGLACGAREGTFSGLSGLGDLTVTCFSPLSRNRGFGERIGRGEIPATVIASSKTLVEGYHAAKSVRELALRRDIYAPITLEVYAMLYEGKNVRHAVTDLLSRDSKAED
ncbi:MAG TPA: NAD(P)H-dependent glycerol-3-phosphate dehydrogenase [Candidatus Limnocylindria bacterium]|jgi:glycerol-3-phosphate dehydrogenase (NAD(P)+)|nr:NAD(P)H-dependent glycerol-3-phosphate dehydrogenase [Candidatus Limnocylindria bacterium]